MSILKGARNLALSLSACLGADQRAALDRGIGAVKVGQAVKGMFSN